MSQRLLLVTDSHEPSGLGEHMLALAQGLAGTFELTLAAPLAATGDLLSKAAALGLRAEALADDGASIIGGERFDLVHIHAGIGWEGHRLAELASGAGVEVVVRTEHLPYVLTDPVQQAAYWDGLDHVCGLICVSAASAASFVAAGVSGDMISVVRNGVVARSPAVGRADMRRDIGIADEAPLAITVARLAPQKNHAALLSALPEILAARPGFRLALVGAGPLEAELREAAAPLGEAVLFLGHRNDVPGLLAAADLFVLPSLFEGLPLSLIEAMAAGLPVVASDVGGIDEVVARGVTGHLAAPEELASAILALLRDPDAAARMGKAGKRRFETDFSHARMSRQTRDVYARLARAAGAQIRMMA